MIKFILVMKFTNVIQDNLSKNYLVIYEIILIDPIYLIEKIITDSYFSMPNQSMPLASLLEMYALVGSG